MSELLALHCTVFLQRVYLTEKRFILFTLINHGSNLTALFISLLVT